MSESDQIDASNYQTPTGTVRHLRIDEVPQDQVFFLKVSFFVRFLNFKF